MKTLFRATTFTLLLCALWSFQWKTTTVASLEEFAPKFVEILQKEDYEQLKQYLPTEKDFKEWYKSTNFASKEEEKAAYEKLKGEPNFLFDKSKKDLNAFRAWATINTGIVWTKIEAKDYKASVKAKNNPMTPLLKSKVLLIEFPAYTAENKVLSFQISGTELKEGWIITDIQLLK